MRSPKNQVRFLKIVLKKSTYSVFPVAKIIAFVKMVYVDPKFGFQISHI